MSTGPTGTWGPVCFLWGQGRLVQRHKPWTYSALLGDVLQGTQGPILLNSLFFHLQTDAFHRVASIPLNTQRRRPPQLVSWKKHCGRGLLARIRLWTKQRAPRLQGQTYLLTLRALQTTDAIGPLCGWEKQKECLVTNLSLPRAVAGASPSPKCQDRLSSPKLTDEASTLTSTHFFPRVPLWPREAQRVHDSWADSTDSYLCKDHPWPSSPSSGSALPRAHTPQPTPPSCFPLEHRLLETPPPFRGLGGSRK